MDNVQRIVARLEVIQPLFKWIFLPLLVATGILWFSYFPLNLPFDHEGAVIEGLILLFICVAYLFISGFRFPLLELGAGIFLYGGYIDLLNEFTWEPELISTIEGLIKVSGLVLVSIGLYSMHFRFQQDLARAKERESILRESEEKYRILAESMEDGVFLIDQTHVFRYLNTAGAKMLHSVPDRIVARSIEIVFPDKADLFILNTDRVFETAVPFSEETRIRKDELDFWVEIRLVPVTGTAGVDYVMGIVRDISERKLNEEALKKAQFKLNLLSSVTRHDVLNQVAVLKGYNEILRDVVRDPAVIEKLERQDAAVDAISEMISFTSDYQEIGLHSPQWQSVLSSFSRARSQVNLHGVSLHLPENDTLVYADPLLEKVFYNLMDNSLRHGEHVSEIAVSVLREDGSIAIVYEDNGSGIPADQKEKIFSRSFGKHTGFGMFLAKEILSITGLDIQENGEPGKGVRFLIRVPMGMWRQGTQE